MRPIYYNDQAYIAQGFQIDEDYAEQTARLASFKINSYKLTQVKAGLRKTKNELVNNLKQTLFNYTSPAIILADRGFFRSEYEN